MFQSVYCGQSAEHGKFHIETIDERAMKNLLFLFVIAMATHGYTGEQTSDLGDFDLAGDQEISGLSYAAAFEKVNQEVAGLSSITVKKLIRVAYMPSSRLFDAEKLDRLIQVVQWKLFQKGQQLAQINEIQALQQAVDSALASDQAI